MKLSINKTFTTFSFIIFLSSAVFGQSPKMILVEGGTFTMGTNSGDPEEKPAHKVTVSTFYICENEVTVSEYKQFSEEIGKAMPEPPDKEWMDTHTPTKMLYASTGKTWWGWKETFPMHNVNWYDAMAYCNWLSAKNGLDKCYLKNEDGGWDLDRTKNGYRLPTEAEWEFAATGGNKSQKYKYSGSNNIDDVCWYDETTRLAGPKDVKTKKPNELGIYDMSGNVWEWCSDYFKTSFYATSPDTDPFSASASPYRSLRGGSWHYQDKMSLITTRDGPKSGLADYNYGFRVAKNK